jgi:hypothetical protein
VAQRASDGADAIPTQALNIFGPVLDCCDGQKHPIGPERRFVPVKVESMQKVIDSISSPGNADLHQATRPERHPETRGYLHWRFMRGLREKRHRPARRLKARNRTSYRTSRTSLSIPKSSWTPPTSRLP